MQSDKPTVIIQWSCDPKPYDNIVDTIYEKRVYNDSKGLVNSRFFWKELSKKYKYMSFPKNYKPITHYLNKDFNTIRNFEKFEKKQYFYDLEDTDPSF